MFLYLLLFLAPGYFLCRLLCRPTDGLTLVTLSATIGLLLSSWTSFLVAYLLWRPITPSFLLVVGLALTAATAALWWRFRRRPTTEPAYTPETLDPLPRRVQQLVLVLAGLVGLLFYWNFDHYLFSAGSCVIDTVLGLGSPDPGDLVTLRHDWFNQHQRMGSIALLTPFYALLGVNGFRVLYALLAFLDVLLLFQLCRSQARSTALCLAVALIGVLNPLVVQIPAMEENMLAIFVSLGFLALLVHEPRSAGTGLLAGLLFACFIGVRYIEFLAIPGVAYYFLRVQPGPRRRRALAFAATAAVGVAPWLLHNLYGLGSLLAFPSEDTLAAAGGAATGLPVPRFANFPFFDHIVRTPFNAHPTWLLHPLNFLRNSGIVLTAILGLGLFAWLRTPRSPGRFLILLAAPTVLLLGGLENWLKPNKLGVVLIVYPVAMLALLEGLKRLAEPRRAYWLALPAVCLALGALVLGSRQVDIPADPRTYDSDEGRWVHSEQPSIVELERERYAELQLLPNFAAYSRYSPFLAWWKLADFPLDRGEGLPRCLFHPAVVDPPGAAAGPRWIAIRTDANWYRSQEWLSSHDEATPSDDGAPLRLHGGEPVTWVETRSPRTHDHVHVILYRCHGVIFVMRLHDDLRSFAVNDDVLVREGFEWLFLRHRPAAAIHFRSVEPPTGGVARFERHEATSLVLIDVLSDTYELAYIWDVPLTGPEIELPPPRRFYMP